MLFNRNVKVKNFREPNLFNSRVERRPKNKLLQYYILARGLIECLSNGLLNIFLPYSINPIPPTIRGFQKDLILMVNQTIQKFMNNPG